MARRAKAQRTATRVGEKSPAPVARDAGAAKLEKAIAEWQSGKQLAAAAVTAGLKRSKFRRMIIKALGSKAAFEAARASGAGGGGRAAKGTPRPRVSDAGLKYLKRGSGWSVRRVWIPKVVKIKTDEGVGKVLWRECAAMVFVSPKGNEYIRANAGEAADALVRGVHGLPDTRLKRYVGSRLEQRTRADAERAAAVAERAAAIQDEDKAKRVARREARNRGGRRGAR